MKNETNNNYSIFNIFLFSKPYIKWCIVGILASIIVAMIDVISADCIKFLTDSTLSGQSILLKDIFFYISILLLIGVPLKYLVSVAWAKFSFYTVRDLKDMLIKKIETTRISWIESNDTGKIITKLTSDINVTQAFLKDTFPKLVHNIIAFIFVFIYLCILNFRLTVLSLAIAPISIFIINLLSRSINKYASNEQESLETVMSISQDAMSGVCIERAYNLNDVLQKKFTNAVNQGLVNSLQRQKITSLTTPFKTVIKWIPLIFCAVYGGYLVYLGDLTTGSLMSFIFLLQYLVEPISEIQEFISDFRGSAVSINRLNELLYIDIEESAGNDFLINMNSPLLEFDHVNFNYSNKINVLNDINFKLYYGKSIAFVGSSGCGKSTIIKLICQFYRLDKGNINLYGKNIDLWDIEAARKQIAIVSQDIHMIPSTIAENISLGNIEASFEQIVEAAKLANAHEFIIQLPEGYQTVLSEKGGNLSVGQRQRISIARAILKNAPIMLFDEPTSALDNYSEKLIQDSINKLMKTHSIILIAHRLSMIKGVDEIFVIDHGNIIEHGKHEELMLKDGMYKKLYIKQNHESKISITDISTDT